MPTFYTTATLAAVSLFAVSAATSTADDARTVAGLDIAYQAAVLKGDAQAMARIFHDDFTLINGKGLTSNRKDWLDAARSGEVRYQHQEAIDNSRTVRVSGDTAVVTAKLWIKGERKDGGAIERVLWYSDTYVRTVDGWKYFVGQASLALPDAAAVAAQSPGADADAVRAMNDQYIRAWRMHDMDWFRANLADDFVCIGPDGAVLSKQAFVDYPDQGANVASAHLEDLSVRVFGGSAVVSARNVVSWKNGKRSATRYTDSYVKVDGRWRVVAAQLTVDRTYKDAIAHSSSRDDDRVSVSALRWGVGGSATN
ncbi:MAG: nuclear transport factor 2 family protein [Pseudomonadota bacterium]